MSKPKSVFDWKGPSSFTGDPVFNGVHQSGGRHADLREMPADPKDEKNNIFVISPHKKTKTKPKPKTKNDTYPKP
jgi:hypothetical protein